MDNNQIMKPPGGHPSWKNRKRVIFVTIFFCMFCIGYIMLTGQDLAISANIIISAFGLLGSVIGFYVAGASWTDINLEKINAQRQAIEYETSVSPKIQARRIVHEDIYDYEDENDPEILPRLTEGRGEEDL